MRLINRLLNKSKQTFLLSLETYNRLTTEYRIEAFCILFINAWELLLKAKILKDTKKLRSIFYKKEKNQQRKSISLVDCLNKIFNENDPARRNIQEIQELRDSSIHLIVDEIDKIYVGIFQAGVLNYVSFLNQWFDINLNEEINPAMLSIMFDIASLDFIKIKSKYGKEVLDFLKTKQEKIFRNTLETKDKRYNVEIEYKLALIKNPKKADIILSTGEIGDNKGVLIEVPKDIRETHPFRAKEVIEEVNRFINKKITSYDIQAIGYKENIRKKSEFYYNIPKITPNLYSKKFVNLIINNINSSSDYLSKVRGDYKIYMDKKREENKLKKLKSNNNQEIFSSS